MTQQAVADIPNLDSALSPPDTATGGPGEVISYRCLDYLYLYMYLTSFLYTLFYSFQTLRVIQTKFTTSFSQAGKKAL